MDSPNFKMPDLDTFCLLDGLGLTATGQDVTASHGVITYRGIDPDEFCRECGVEGVPRGTVVRRLAYLRVGWRPTILHARVRTYRCIECRHVWRQDMTQAASA